MAPSCQRWPHSVDSHWIDMDCRPYLLNRIICQSEFLPARGHMWLIPCTPRFPKDSGLRYVYICF
jgi:hypothetical protein